MDFYIINRHNINFLQIYQIIGVFMKRIVGLFLLLLSLPWLAQAAAIESVTCDQIAHSASAGEYSTSLRMQLISKPYPKLVEFLARKPACQEIPTFGAKFHLFAICDKTSTLVIVPCQNSSNIPGEIIVWDLKANKLLHHVANIPFQIHEVHVTPNGSKIIAISQNHVGIWDINGNHEYHDLGEGNHIVLNHDGSKLLTASYNGGYRVWDLESGQQKYHISNEQTFCGCNEPLALSPDGTKIARAGDDIHMFDLLTGQTFKLGVRDPKNAYPTACSLAFSPDGTQLMGMLVPSRPHDIYGKAVWSVATQKQLSYENSEEHTICTIGNKRAEYSFLSDGTLISIFDNTTDQLLCSAKNSSYNSPHALTDHWLVWHDDTGKFYSLDLERAAAFQHDIASLSDLQLELIDRIRKKAEYNMKFMLNRNEPGLARIIKAYDMLPDSIKDFVQYQVAWINE